MPRDTPQPPKVARSLNVEPIERRRTAKTDVAIAIPIGRR